MNIKSNHNNHYIGRLFLKGVRKMKAEGKPTHRQKNSEALLYQGRDFNPLTCCAAVSLTVILLKSISQNPFGPAGGLLIDAHSDVQTQPYNYFHHGTLMKGWVKLCVCAAVLSRWSHTQVKSVTSKKVNYKCASWSVCGCWNIQRWSIIESCKVISACFLHLEICLLLYMWRGHQHFLVQKYTDSKLHLFKKTQSNKHNRAINYNFFYYSCWTGGEKNNASVTVPPVV